MWKTYGNGYQYYLIIISTKGVNKLGLEDYGKRVREFLSTRQITEKEYTKSIYYLLPKEEQFFWIAYKVLQEQHKNGFLKCAKVLQNGKIKLIYDIEGYKSLINAVEYLTPEKFLTIIYYLVDVFKEIKNIGRIYSENTLISLERIYIDPSNLRVFLLCLPLSTQTSPDSDSICESLLKKFVSDLLFYNPKINNNDTQVIRKALLTDKDIKLEFLKDCLSNMGHPISAAIDPKLWADATKEEYETGKSTSEHMRTISITNQADAVTRKLQLLVLKLRQRGAKTKLPLNNRLGGFKPKLMPAVIFYPQIALVSQDESKAIAFTISKPAFIIGKDIKAVDGVIASNQFVSGIHCKIVWKQGQYYIEDMASMNHTYVNGTSISPNSQHPIDLGDVVKLANMEFEVQLLSDGRAANKDIDADESDAKNDPDTPDFDQYLR
jgi:hypothetical protein